MKNISTIFLLLVAVLFTTSSIFAGDKTVVADVLQIPYTSEAPDIDGEIDNVWLSVTATNMIKHEGGSEDSAGVYDDHFTTFRTMWDEDYFYIFVTVVDEELDGSEKASPWMSDAVEIFFDGGNDDAAAYDDNDRQWRYVYGEVQGDTANAGDGPGDFVFLDTESGYNLEVRISADTLASRFALEDETEIGFEISNADRDEGVGQQNVFHWWTTNGRTWAEPALFGTAVLMESKEVNSVLNIHYTDTEPDIDGVFDEEEGWEYADEISLTKLENDLLPDTVFDSWRDHLTSFWTMWDENNLYLFVSVIDEELDGSEKASPWMSDAVELFIDGGNDDAAAYDDNDRQWRYVYGEVQGDTANAGDGPGDFMFLDTEWGYNLEVKIPKDTLASRFALENDTEIGFELSNADRDEGVGQQSVLHWWTSNGRTWAEPALFGTAVLIGGEAVAVEKLEELPTEFALEQNYPNPFNPTTNITYSIVKSGNVNISVYDVIGREVATLVNESQAPGKYNVSFDASGLTSGLYFYTIKAGSVAMTKKMMLLK